MAHSSSRQIRTNARNIPNTSTMRPTSIPRSLFLRLLIAMAAFILAANQNALGAFVYAENFDTGGRVGWFIFPGGGVVVSSGGIENSAYLASERIANAPLTVVSAEAVRGDATHHAVQQTVAVDVEKIFFDYCSVTQRAPFLD